MTIPYEWNCPHCQHENAKHQLFCTQCHLPVKHSQKTLEEWHPERKNQPIIPTELRVSDEISQCIQCKKYMYIIDSTCPHCHYQLTLTEKEHFLKKHDHKINTGKWLGIITAISIIILLLLFSTQ